MKKVIIAAAVALLSSVVLSAAEVKSKTLSEDMKAMMNAMIDIEKSWFYENPTGIKDGVARLKKSLKTLETSDAKGYLPKDQQYANKFAKKRATMIEMYADDLIESIDANEKQDAIDNYTQIMNQCTSCHMRIRNW